MPSRGRVQGTGHMGSAQPSSFAPSTRDEANPRALRQVIEELESRNAQLTRELRMLRIANSELERVAVRDALTPAYNRRYFIGAIHDRIARLRRHGTPSAVIFIDVDRMKALNDSFGHGAGDFALVHLSRILLEHVRVTDVLARIGGDEFALILDEIAEDEAKAKMMELARAVTDEPCMFGTDALPVGASFGLTMVRPDDSDEDVLSRADTDMYAMKRDRAAQRSDR